MGDEFPPRYVVDAQTKTIRDGIERLAAALERLSSSIELSARASARLTATLDQLLDESGEEYEDQDPQSMGWVGSDGRP